MSTIVCPVCGRELGVAPDTVAVIHTGMHIDHILLDKQAVLMTLSPSAEGRRTVVSTSLRWLSTVAGPERPTDVSR